MMAFIRVIGLALALASSSVVWSSHPFESARDQYEARQDRPQLQLLAEATDHRPEVRTSQQADFIEKSTNNTTSKQPTAPDLQVGCGDGFIREKLSQNSESDKNKIQKLIKTSVGPKKRRRRRSYSPFANQPIYSQPYSSISVWQPPQYQLSRPYFIPIFGVAGRVPIYFPPQPLYTNTEAPKDNPDPFKGPEYLPPISDRYDDDRPKWDVSDNNQITERPSQGSTTIIPTRRPRPQRPRPRPPLVHNPTDPEGFDNVGPSNENEISTTSAPVSTTRPPQPSFPNRPVPQPRPNEPSRCVWAIISCCSGSTTINYECFEQRGCPGAFWDSSPCEGEFAQAAISAALNYYNK